MGVLADLVASAQPALVGGGCAAEATEGATWRFAVTGIKNAAGADVNLSSGVTGNCVVLSGGTTLATLAFAGGVGGFTLSLDEATTVGLAGGDSVRRCTWSLTLADGTDVVQVWGPANSPFHIYPAAS